MDTFTGKIAVIAGGGTGIGRSLAVQLAAAGCHVAIGDVIEEHLAEVVPLCLAGAPAGTRVTGHKVDVASQQDMCRFRDEVRQQHSTDHIHLLFNNAGISGGGSFIEGDRKEWERTFNVCWYGVYHGCRAFMDMVTAADSGHIINTSSINGLFASLGPHVAHTAYSSAKFAVRGFTEGLIDDLRLHAPHVGVSLVMPGHVDTALVANSGKVLGRKWGMEMSAAETAAVRAQYLQAGLPVDNYSDEQIRTLRAENQLKVNERARVSSDQAAEIILEGVREQRWRILIGDDAHALDALVRAHPEEMYDPAFVASLQSANSD